MSTPSDAPLFPPTPSRGRTSAGTSPARKRTRFEPSHDTASPRPTRQASLSSDSRPLCLDREAHSPAPRAELATTRHCSLRHESRDAVEHDEQDMERLPSIASLAIQQGAVGASVWHGPSRTLTMLPDTLVGGHPSSFGCTDREDPGSSSPPPSGLCREKDTVDMILEQYRPTVVLVSSGLPFEHAESISKNLQSWDGELAVRPAREFNPQAGRSKLLTLKTTITERIITSGAVAPETDHDGELDDLYGKELALSAYLELDSMPASCASLAPLLSQAWRVLAPRGAGQLVASIECMHLTSLLMVPSSLRSALGVLPSAPSITGGLTLLHVLDKTVSPLGRNLLKRWLAFPSTDRDLISARYDAVQILSVHTLQTEVNLLRNQLKAMANVPSLLTEALAEGSVPLSTWKKVHKFCSLAMEARYTLAPFASRAPLLASVYALIDPLPLESLERALNVIDWVESAQEHNPVIKSGIDKELDNLREAFEDLPELLASVAGRLKERVVDEFGQVMQVQYFPQLGYLISLPIADLSRWSRLKNSGEEADESELSTEVDSLPDIEGLRFAFTSNVDVFYKSREMEEMDEHLGDLHTSITDREVEILEKLYNEVIARQDTLLQAARALAQLDCLISFAIVARDHNYVRPNLVEDNVVHIVNGRHPMAEQYLDTFVPNNVDLIGGLGVQSAAVPVNLPDEVVNVSSERSSGDGGNSDKDKSEDEKKYNSMVIVTGSNCGGKSMYIKQNALIVYMAQCGCFVPAESATLGVCDKILGSIRIVESSSSLQSSFLVDMAQVSFALRQTTSRSLLLLDEVATATNKLDGAAIFASIVEDVLLRGTEMPKTIVATHYYDVFLNGLILRDSDEMRGNPGKIPFTPAHMEVLFPRQQVPGRTSDETEEMVYLFKVTTGFASVSHAAHCAQLLGLPTCIVQRAQYATSLLLRGEAACLAWEGYDDLPPETPWSPARAQARSATGLSSQMGSAVPAGGEGELAPPSEDTARVPPPLHRLELVMRLIPPLLDTDLQAMLDAALAEEGGSGVPAAVASPMRDWVRSLLRLAAPSE